MAKNKAKAAKPTPKAKPKSKLVEPAHAIRPECNPVKKEQLEVADEPKPTEDESPSVVQVNFGISNSVQAFEGQKESQSSSSAFNFPGLETTSSSFNQQLSNTVNELDTFSARIGELSRVMLSEHTHFEQQLKSAEEHTRNAMKEAQERRARICKLRHLCASVQVELTLVKALTGSAHCMERDAQTEATEDPIKHLLQDWPPETCVKEDTVSGGVEERSDRTVVEAAEDYKDAAEESQEDQTEDEFAEVEDEDWNGEAEMASQEKNDEQPEEEATEKKGWFGGWFKKT